MSKTHFDRYTAYHAFTAAGGVDRPYRSARLPATCSFDDLPDSGTDRLTVPR